MWIGFSSSVLANRLIFLAGAAGIAAAHTGLLWLGGQAGWRRGRLGGSLLLIQGAGLFLLGGLIGRHQEILDLGFRAFLPDIYRAWLTMPATAFGAGGLLVALGALSFFLASGPGSSQRLGPMAAATISRRP